MDQAQTQQPQQAKQPTGNFVGFKTRSSPATSRPRQGQQPENGKSARRRPDFDGRIAIPGTEREFPIALWAGKDRNNKVMFTGQSGDIATSDSAVEQIEALANGGHLDAAMLAENNLNLRPGQIVLFANTYKDESSPKRPDYYGRWHPGVGDKLVTVSVWARQSRYGQPMLTGQTQYAQPGRDMADAARADEQPQLSDHGGDKSDGVAR
jgi:hypothetical protein